MDLKEEVFSHHENVWVLGLGAEATKGPLSPLADSIDWYNNQIISKSLINTKISVEKGQQNLFSGGPCLPAKKIVVFGLGDEKKLDEKSAKEAAQQINAMLAGLQEKTCWIVMSPMASDSFLEEFNRQRSKLELLSQALVSVG